MPNRCAPVPHCAVALSVLHVSESVLGGVGHVISDLGGAQRAAGWQVSVAAPASVAGATVGGWHAWSPGARPGPGLPRSLVQLRGIVADVDPDLVHLHTSMAGMCGRLVLRRRVPTVFQPHSWSFFAVTGAARAGAIRWERFAARWTDVVLCVSEDERRSASALGIRARYEVVPNGVDLTRFADGGQAERSAARERLGLDDARLAVCVGRLHRQKGQHALLDAWPGVLARLPTARLALVGDGPDRAALEARAALRTTFVGQTPDVQQWVAASDVVVQPSVWEGMSLSLLEAMATGRSVVVTDVPGMAEVVTAGTGAVVPSGSADALANAVAQRLADPVLAAAEGAAGAAAMRQGHDVMRQREAVLRLCAELVAG